MTPEGFKVQKFHNPWQELGVEILNAKIKELIPEEKAYLASQLEDFQMLAFHFFVELYGNDPEKVKELLTSDLFEILKDEYA